MKLLLCPELTNLRCEFCEMQENVGQDGDSQDDAQHFPDDSS